ncbi:MAG: hypothetical protein RL607_516 [Bacteroidota bacterium]|jgi:glycosyltransferase involved in cell wall biosynthesis
MKRKVLFVMPSLHAGGAEKSLVNLLNAFDFNSYEIDLLLLNKNGVFLKLLPQEVNILTPKGNYSEFAQPLQKALWTFLKQRKWTLLYSRFVYFLLNNIMENKGKAEQYSWKYLRNALLSITKEYDAAIGFLEKTSIYTIVDCVPNAKHKIGFIHNDYTKLELDADFDRPYFEHLTHILTVSEVCVKVLKSVFEPMQSKVNLMYNIISEQSIHTLANSEVPEMNASNTIVSLGRLHPQKGFDVAIEACKILVDGGIPIYWYILGEGESRVELEQKIQDYKLEPHFILLGIKENPYSYLKKATIYAQPSRYEGKSLAIDEAKILHKPILVTDFSSAKDQITDGINGKIVAFDPNAIAEGLQDLLQNESIRNTLSHNLQKIHYGTESEIVKLYTIINS